MFKVLTSFEIDVSLALDLLDITSHMLEISSEVEKRHIIIMFIFFGFPSNSILYRPKVI